ncbi:CAP-associated domain-containing protein [Paenibacillus melissococcoides]|uniref:CAP-associated domain-containing protein n=1 Tax=Paenibacillus TaxID=44249 RepID=UPI0021C2BE36|nr:MULTISPECIES: CAP-associated domain-containing protein [Paenibacillus]MEB9894315.1 CAP-associated domain-containing protein [Bacillus cereus]CAH8715505.1 CAP-associated domain-containing protein [Paenibacillus melissococcoides]CAH8716464.1 CAP-associated domain-containing protein [Paenibacillus melissococcoides]
MSEPELIGLLGEHARKDLSEYNFEWYIYNQNYQRYIQVGGAYATLFYDLSRKNTSPRSSSSIRRSSCRSMAFTASRANVCGKALNAKCWI